jgi:hypothetical protein
MMNSANPAATSTSTSVNAERRIVRIESESFMMLAPQGGVVDFVSDYEFGFLRFSVTVTC